MTVKYECHNQLTGLLEEAPSFEEAKVLRDRLKAEYIAALVDPLFLISVLVQNENGSWTQALADKNGYPIVLEPSVELESLDSFTDLLLSKGA